MTDPIDRGTRGDERLELALEQGELALWDMDATSGLISWDARGLAILGFSRDAPFSGQDWTSRVHPADRADVERMKTAAFRGPTRQTVETRFRFLRGDGEWRHLAARYRVERDAEGVPTGLRGVLLDETVRRREEGDARRVLGELQHRTKNIVAIIRSIASRTRENSRDLDDFLAHFEGRLNVVGRIHLALARTGAGTLSLDEIVREELRQCGGSDTGRIQIGGPNVVLQQTIAEPLALAVHELTTNSTKFGALSDVGGDVSIQWSVTRPAPRRLVFHWTETLDAPVEGSSRRGFGRETIERHLPYQLGAVTSLSIEPQTVVCRLDLPLDSHDR